MATEEIPQLKERTHVVLTNQGQVEVQFQGYLLGEGTSYRPTHMHPPGSYPPRGTRCPGCRWTDTRILWSTDDKCYVVTTIGNTQVPEEQIRTFTIWTSSSTEVVESLLVNPPSHVKRTRPQLPSQNEEAVESAADYDDAIDQAYSTWVEEDERLENAS